MPRQIPKVGESVAEKFPDLMLDWCNDNEGTLYEYKTGSNYKAHWKCHICKEESIRTIYGATTYQCKKCSIINRSIKKDIAGKSLYEAFTEIAEQWDYSKNSGGPKTETHCSGRKVWWVCDEGHEWEQTIANRTGNNSGCPVCARNKNSIKLRNPKANKSLADLYNSIACEIDTSKNNVDATKIAYGSHDILWWKCKRGHSYKQMVAQRTLKGYGCPICSCYGTSYGEQIVFRAIKKVFNNVTNRDKSLGFELDIKIGDMFAIEYSGENWHKNKDIIDSNKNQMCKLLGIRLIQIKEINSTESMQIVDENTFSIGGSCKDKEAEIIKIVVSIIKQYNKDLSKEQAIEAVKEASEFRHGKPEVGESLAEQRNELLNEWDYELNVADPFYIKTGSNYKAHWICKKCGFKWQSLVYNRAKLNTGCPKCNTN